MNIIVRFVHNDALSPVVRFTQNETYFPVRLVERLTGGGSASLTVDADGNAALTGAALIVDNNGHATLTGATLAVDQDGNAMVA